MRGERITEARLKQGGASAASAVFQDVCALLNIPEAERSDATKNIKVHCVYKGTNVPDAPLHSQQAVTYEWFVDEHGPFEYKTYVNKTVDHPSLHHLCASMIGPNACTWQLALTVNRILHGKKTCPKMHAPRQVKATLIWRLLPQHVAKQRTLPFLARVAAEDQIHCHALAFAKMHEGPYETVELSDEAGCKAEHLKLAHVSGTKWVVHPGTSLSTSLMFITDIPKEAKSPPHKRSKAKSEPVVVEKMKPIENGEALSKLFAVAHLFAEVKRASIEERVVDVNAAHALFDKSPQHKGNPKQVFVLWSAASSGCVEEHVNEVAFKTLFHKQL